MAILVFHVHLRRKFVLLLWVNSAIIGNQVKLIIEMFPVTRVLINVLLYTEGRPTDSLWNSLSLCSSLLLVFSSIDSTCLVFPSFHLYLLNSERPTEPHVGSSSSHRSLKTLSRRWAGAKGLPFLFFITQGALFLIAVVICHHL